jgi:1-acyl-sn-glycerol-3-phosphate acyltransferase
MVREAGYISNESPELLLSDCAQALQRGGALVIFPEGTRTAPGRSMRFLRGAAHIALRSGRQILPVILHCEPSTLTKGLPWYRVPPRPFHFRVDVRAPLRAEDLVDPSEPESLGARHLTRKLCEYFSKEVEVYGRS